MSIATYLNTGLAILGWAYIMVKAGQWITKNALRQWDKRRKESRRQSEAMKRVLMVWGRAPA